MHYKDFAKHYHARHILRDIGNLNPNFYPNPMEPLKGQHGQPIKVDQVKGDYLTKEELIEAYDICSDLLHAENPFAPPKDPDKIKERFEGWLKKTTILLSFHSIQLMDTKRQLWVVMRSSDGEGVSVTLMSRE